VLHNIYVLIYTKCLCAISIFFLTQINHCQSWKEEFYIYKFFLYDFNSKYFQE